SQRLRGQHLARLGRFPIIPAPAVLAVTPREVGRLHKGPAQILIATLLIVVCLVLAIAQALGINHAAVAGKIAIALKALDLAYLHRNRHRQNPSYSRNGQEPIINWYLPGTAQHRLLYSTDAF